MSISTKTNKKAKRNKAVIVAGREDLLGRERSRFPHFLENRFAGGCDVVILTRRPPFTQRTFLALISVSGRAKPTAIMLLRKLCKLKNLITPSGFETATVRLIA
jgi:hypothetical protein